VATRQQPTMTAGLDPHSVIVLDPGESWQFYR
jgi:hypothetical protein